MGGFFVMGNFSLEILRQGILEVEVYGFMSIRVRVEKGEMVNELIKRLQGQYQEE